MKNAHDFRGVEVPVSPEVYEALRKRARRAGVSIGAIASQLLWRGVERAQWGPYWGGKRRAD